MQKHILAAIVGRDETEPARMIEELDHSGLTHGKLLSPFQMVSAWQNALRRVQASLESGKRNRARFPRNDAEHLHPGSQSARKNASL
jgi:hypothetical protein